MRRRWKSIFITWLLLAAVGWWGIPWGPIYSIQSLYTNITGGHDVTDQIVVRQPPLPQA